jgi:hypothetical protein
MKFNVSILVALLATTQACSLVGGGVGGVGGVGEVFDGIIGAFGQIVGGVGGVVSGVVGGTGGEVLEHTLQFLPRSLGR